MSNATDGISHEPLEKWFLERVPELSPPLHYEVIHGGMSNLTYLVYAQALLQFDIGGASAGGIVAVILANIVAIFLVRLIGKNLEA